jgi:hypothetical protein
MAVLAKLVGIGLSGNGGAAQRAAAPHMLYGIWHCNRQEHAGVSSNDQASRNPAPAETEPPRRTLTPEAERALAEAEERRRKRDAAAESRPKEIGGQAGPDPTRYGDWEKGGITSDF